MIRFVRDVAGLSSLLPTTFCDVSLECLPREEAGLGEQTRELNKLDVYITMNETNKLKEI